MPVGVGLQHRLSPLIFHLILVNLPGLQPRDKQLENAGIAQTLHGVAPAVPKVKISHYADTHGAGSPNGKINALHPVDGHGVGSHFFINLIVNPRFEFL